MSHSLSDGASNEKPMPYGITFSNLNTKWNKDDEQRWELRDAWLINLCIFSIRVFHIFSSLLFFVCKLDFYENERSMKMLTHRISSQFARSRDTPHNDDLSACVCVCLCVGIVFGWKLQLHASLLFQLLIFCCVRNAAYMIYVSMYLYVFRWLQAIVGRTVQCKRKRGFMRPLTFIFESKWIIMWVVWVVIPTISIENP